MADHLAVEGVGDGTMRHVDRGSPFSMQPPGAHRLSVFLDMFAEVQQQGVSLSENCCGMLPHRLGRPLTFVEGARGNIKVARREDLAVFAPLAAGCS